ncbi:hypothetical protein GCM10009780_18400 [Actinomadura alba]
MSTVRPVRRSKVLSAGCGRCPLKAPGVTPHQAPHEGTSSAETVHLRGFPAGVPLPGLDSDWPERIGPAAAVGEPVSMTATPMATAQASAPAAAMPAHSHVRLFGADRRGLPGTGRRGFFGAVMAVNHSFAASARPLGSTIW